MLSLGYVVNAIAAHYLFGEAVTAQRWLGIGFIIVGVCLVARELTMPQPRRLKFASPLLDEATIAARRRRAALRPDHERRRGSSASRRALSTFCGGRPVRVLTSATAASKSRCSSAASAPATKSSRCGAELLHRPQHDREAGATPVFVDCDLVTRNIELGRGRGARSGRARARSCRRTGRARWSTWTRCTRSRGTTSCASSRTRRSSIGSRWRGRPVGAIGDLVTFSFHPNKNITSIEGGAIVCNDARRGAARRSAALPRHRAAAATARATSRFPAASSTCPTSMRGSASRSSSACRRFSPTGAALADRYFERFVDRPRMRAAATPPRGDDGQSWNMFCRAAAARSAADHAQGVSRRAGAARHRHRHLVRGAAPVHAGPPLRLPSRRPARTPSGSPTAPSRCRCTPP